MARRVNHQDVVSQLLETKAIDFDAIGQAVAKLGPSLALADEPWESFCGTMRMFIRIYRFPGPFGPIEGLADLREVATELQQ